jgi:hypothetical protein
MQLFIAPGERAWAYLYVRCTISIEMKLRPGTKRAWHPFPIQIAPICTRRIFYHAERADIFFEKYLRSMTGEQFYRKNNKSTKNKNKYHTLLTQILTEGLGK